MERKKLANLKINRNKGDGTGAKSAIVRFFTTPGSIIVGSTVFMILEKFQLINTSYENSISLTQNLLTVNHVGLTVIKSYHKGKQTFI